MSERYLGREAAPFGPEVWAALDAAMVEAARSQLAGRRLLQVEGPHGLGLKAVPLGDVEGEAGLAPQLLPLLLIQQPFELGARDLASYERDRIALDLAPVAEAAIQLARREDELIFHGAEGAAGLLTARGAQRLALSSWAKVGSAAGDVINALTILDGAGFHGPYALALAPERYNQLFRLYPQGNRSEWEHLQTIVTDGIVKAPILQSGGLLLATGRQFASIVLGQDMSVGFTGPAGARLAFYISESLAPLVRQPRAFCVLE